MKISKIEYLESKYCDYVILFNVYDYNICHRR